MATYVQDAFASAQDLAVDPHVPGQSLLDRGLLTDFNTGFTAEGGEPAHHGFGPSHSGWFKYTSTLTGTMTFTLQGNNSGDSINLEDAVLAVYTGTSVSALTLVTSGQYAGHSASSSVTLNIDVVAGTTYHFAIDGNRFALTTGGFFRFAATTPVGVLTGDSGSYHGDNTGNAVNGAGTGVALGGMESFDLTVVTSGWYMLDTESTTLPSGTNVGTYLKVGTDVDQYDAGGQSRREGGDTNYPTSGTGRRARILCYFRTGRSYRLTFAFTTTDQPSVDSVRGPYVLSWTRRPAHGVQSGSGSYSTPGAFATLDAFPGYQHGWMELRVRYRLLSGEVPFGTNLVRVRTNGGLNALLWGHSTEEMSATVVSSRALLKRTTVNGVPVNSSVMGETSKPTAQWKEVSFWFWSGYTNVSSGAPIDGYPFSGGGGGGSGTFDLDQASTLDRHLRYIDYGVIDGTGGFSIELEVTVTDDQDSLPLSSLDPAKRHVYFHHGWEAKTRGLAEERTLTLSTTFFSAVPLETNPTGTYVTNNNMYAMPQVEALPGGVSPLGRAGYGLRTKIPGLATNATDKVASVSWQGNAILPHGAGPRYAVSFYFYPLAYPDSAVALHRFVYISSAGNEYSMGLVWLDHSGGLKLRVYSGSPSHLDTTRSLGHVAAGRWHHVEMVMDTYLESVTVRVNGVQHTFASTWIQAAWPVSQLNTFRVGPEPVYDGTPKPKSYDGYLDDVSTYDPGLFPLGGQHVTPLTVDGDAGGFTFPAQWAGGVDHQIDVRADVLGDVLHFNNSGIWDAYPHGTTPFVAPVIVGPIGFGLEAADGNEPAGWGGEQSLYVDVDGANQGIYDGTPRKTPPWGSGVPGIPYYWKFPAKQSGSGTWTLEWDQFTSRGYGMGASFSPGSGWTMVEFEVQTATNDADYWILKSHETIGAGGRLSVKRSKLFEFYVRGPEFAGAYVTSDGGQTYTLVPNATGFYSRINQWPPPNPQLGDAIGLPALERGWGLGDSYLTLSCQDTPPTKRDVYAVRSYIWGGGTGFAGSGNWPDERRLGGFGVLRPVLRTGGLLSRAWVPKTAQQPGTTFPRTGYARYGAGWNSHYLGVATGMHPVPDTLSWDKTKWDDAVALVGMGLGSPGRTYWNGYYIPGDSGPTNNWGNNSGFWLDGGRRAAYEAWMFELLVPEPELPSPDASLHLDHVFGSGPATTPSSSSPGTVTLHLDRAVVHPGGVDPASPHTPGALTVHLDGIRVARGLDAPSSEGA